MRFARHLVRTALAGVMASLVSAGVVHAQQTHRHDVQLTTTDPNALTRWYVDSFGFEPDGESRFAWGDAGLIVTEGASGPSAAIKVALSVPDLDEAFERLNRVSPESVLVEPSPLPPLAEPENWPVRHFLATDSDGTLVRVFEQEERAPSPYWSLMAVTVPDLDDAANRYAGQFGFSEVLRPTTGDPRNLMRRGTFFLELGEFGDAAANGGVSSIVFDVDRPDSDCGTRVTAERITIRYCGFGR